VCPYATDLCPEDVLADVNGFAPIGVETEWWAVTSGMVACGEKLECLDGYGGGAAEYGGRAVSSV